MCITFATAKKIKKNEKKVHNKILGSRNHWRRPADNFHFARCGLVPQQAFSLDRLNFKQVMCYS